MNSHSYILLVITFVLITILILGCDKDDAFKTEVNQVFRVKNSNEGFVAGELIYQDSIIFQNENLPKTKFIFDKNLVITGKENYPEINQSKSIRSDYLSSDGQPLSYYKYDLNDKFQKVKSEAYDASNDELLRYEEMSYDGQGRLQNRRIFTSGGALASSYSFIYDAYGNELRRITQHLLRDTTITEESKITKYFDDKTWQEKWGFVNDKPVAFYKRKVD